MERGSIYPSWRHHPSGKSMLVHSKEEDDALDPEWSDNSRVLEQAQKPVNDVVVFDDPDAEPTGDETTTDEPKKPRGRPKKK